MEGASAGAPRSPPGLFEIPPAPAAASSPRGGGRRGRGTIKRRPRAQVGASRRLLGSWVPAAGRMQGAPRGSDSPLPAMLPPCAEGASRLAVALLAALCCCPWAGASAALGPGSLSSNAIKIPAPGGSAVSASPRDSVLHEGSNKYQPLDAHQPYACGEDEDCAPDEFCSRGGGGGGGAPVCLACRRRRKRCLRDAMCCPGNSCNNGMCAPSEPEQLHAAETEEPGSEGPAPGPEGQPKRTTSLWRLHHAKGQESSICLRSSDCAVGLCCARHFWSKICKPVLKEGQVCTKHRRKGSHGLEIFQRCYCGDGLSCRLQRDHITSNSSSSRLHTCQRH